MVINVTSNTDESGQDTKGKMFVVSTVIYLSSDETIIDKELLKIEGSSEKIKKWHETGDKRRHAYIKEIVNSNFRSKFKIYYSEYQNKSDYSALVGAHIAKSILHYTKDKDYRVKIFIDKLNKKTLKEIGEEIKSFRIKYRKIRGHTEQSSSSIRLADAACGMYRDLSNKNIPKCYKRFFNEFIQV